MFIYNVCVVYNIGGVARFTLAFQGMGIATEREGIEVAYADALQGINKRMLVAIATIVVLGIVFVHVGYAYNATTQNTDNSVSADYTVLGQTGYNFSDNAVFSSDEVVTALSGFTAEVTSEASADDTVVQITFADRSVLADLGPVQFWITSTIDRTVHRAAVTLTVTGTADNNPMFTVEDNVTTGTGTIGAGTGSGQYQFQIKVTDMTSQDSASATATYTQYIIRGAASLCTLSGTGIAGKEIGTDTLVAERASSDDAVNVRLTSSGFTDLGNGGWMYVLGVVPQSGGSAQYAYSTDGESWSYVSGTSLTLTNGTVYDAALYLAGKDGTGYAYTAGKLPGAPISDGRITFTFDSTYSEGD